MNTKSKAERTDSDTDFWAKIMTALDIGSDDPVEAIECGMRLRQKLGGPLEQFVVMDDKGNLHFTSQKAWQTVKLFLSLEKNFADANGNVNAKDLARALFEPTENIVHITKKNPDLFRVAQEEIGGQTVSLIRRAFSTSNTEPQSDR